MTRKSKQQTIATKQKSIRFPLDLIKKIEQISLKERRSFGGSIIKIVEDFLKGGFFKK